MINTLWFIALVIMLGGYAVLDGFDLGVGSMHLWLGRSHRERSQTIAAIGPVWNGNEVWLLAAGGSLVVAFPHVYATSFSGFYLALMLVLWLLLLRGLAIEFRHQIDDDLWRSAWDVVLNVASLLLALLFGVAVGNVLRGVPLDENGEFVGTFTLLLNPFSILGGLLSVAILSMHGANYIAMKTSGEVQQRARRASVPLFVVSAVLLAAMVGASFLVRPDFTDNFGRWPWLVIAPVGALVAAVMTFVLRKRGDDRGAFLAGAGWVLLIMVSVAAGLYPELLPARAGSAHPGLDVFNSASPQGSLEVALGIYAFGMTLVIIYMVNVYRVWRGKVSASGESH